LIFHEWMGIGAHERHSADLLASYGYLALAADVYGRDDRPKTTADAPAYTQRYRAGDRALMRARAQAALAALRAHPLCDPSRVAAIGYCFGGTVALELARDGAELRAVVTFHAGLGTERPAGPGGLKSPILALHGAEDRFVPAAEVAAFQNEMRTSGADWQFVQHGGAVHSYTNPGAGNKPEQGFAYHERAARRSWNMMRSFLSEVFSQGQS
ncbi:MAG TPA: dienelactone hydrolase family protein, partial [Acidiferrobacteraceae bacterium]|nr:dienelactone hydrolase family protein [Acidiferrobacteraceae bacterium]